MKMMDKLSRLLFILIIGCLLQLALSLANASSRPEWQWSTSARAGLTQIAMRLRFAEQPIEDLLGCNEEKTQQVRWVSAEKVFAPVLNKLSMPEDILVHGMYRAKIKPSHREAKTVVGKWASSYTTWCMPPEKWKLARHFWWYHDMKDLPLPFPILWDKKPELCGEAVPVLAINLSIHSVPLKNLDQYLEAASQWIQPRTQPVEEVLEMLRSDAVENRISAVRLLGARKDPEYIPAIAASFKDDRLEVRRAAGWALGMIGGPGAIAHLEANVEDRSSGVRAEIASALGRIGGEATVEPLARLLKDQKATVRREAATSMAATKSEKAIPFLVEALADEDKVTRQAALESLIQLGWRPSKQ